MFFREKNGDLVEMGIRLFNVRLINIGRYDSNMPGKRTFRFMFRKPDAVLEFEFTPIRTTFFVSMLESER
jgi:hypothetical protein